MRKKLKPCPFCGNEDLKIKEFRGYRQFLGYYIYCKKCGTRMYSESVCNHFIDDQGRFCTPIDEKIRKVSLNNLPKKWNNRLVY